MAAPSPSSFIDLLDYASWAEERTSYLLLSMTQGSQMESQLAVWHTKFFHKHRRIFFIMAKKDACSYIIFFTVDQEKC